MEEVKEAVETEAPASNELSDEALDGVAGGFSAFFQALSNINKTRVDSSSDAIRNIRA